MYQRIVHLRPINFMNQKHPNKFNFQKERKILFGDFNNFKACKGVLRIKNLITIPSEQFKHCHSLTHENITNFSTGYLHLDVSLTLKV